MLPRRSFSFTQTMPLLVLAGFALAGMVAVFIDLAPARLLLATILILGSAPYAWRTLSDFFRGKFGVDIIAIAAMATSFVLNEYLAGAVILLMLSGGEALEQYALARARRQLTNLLNRAPSIAHRKRGTRLTDIPVSKVALGDHLLVKQGEPIPVDGFILDGVSLIDESMITGEPLPVEKKKHSPVQSGSINVGDVIIIHATHLSHDSRYQQIVRLVTAAEKNKAPIVRLADRFSASFTFITALIASFAWWYSQDPLLALAVLVVATPCPLIVATPVAIMSAVSLAAKRGIIVKHGGALEILSRATIFIFDKTGTITLGEPRVAQVIGLKANTTDVLRLAASIDQMSAHVLARSLVKEARARDLTLTYPTDPHETIAQGITGILHGKKYNFGKLEYVRHHGAIIPPGLEQSHQQHKLRGEKIVYLSQGKHLLGGIAFADRIRKETKDLFTNMRHTGVKQLLMLSGDKSAVAKRIAASVGITQAHGDLLPEDKVHEVQKLRNKGNTVAMVGDGVNDAPALASADVGIAMGSHGGSAASEAADIVITVDDLSRVGEAREISQRMLHIALQSIYLGMGASICLMLIAAAGFLSPVNGAVLQEALDITVILNALRVAGGRRTSN